jgi:transcriptional regulator with XRE-family HTH domain
MTNSLTDALTNSSGAENPLGSYLKDRRARLEPAAFGFTSSRRRTPGLRREEVAARANVSTTWYTWLEQGRGGAPSADVLDRIARALMLTEVEREHLFLLGLGRAPDVKYRETESVTPRLQRLLDTLEAAPALIRTATWDVVAWNRAATAVLADYAVMEAAQRNIIRMMFGSDHVRAAQPDWESVARFVVASFRADATRAGATEQVRELVAEMCAKSPDFARLWADHDVRHHGEGTKFIKHRKAGLIGLEYSAFAVDARPDLTLVIYNPATAKDADKIRRLLKISAR